MADRLSKLFSIKMYRNSDWKQNADKIKLDIKLIPYVSHKSNIKYKYGDSDIL